MQKTNLGTRDQIIESYLTTIEDSFCENRSQLKLINYGTGSGKTHQLFAAICQTIQTHPDSCIIGIYIAPLREHLQVPDSIRKQYQNIPIYTLHSLEMRMTEAYLDNYKKWIKDIIKGDFPEEIKENLQKSFSKIDSLKYIEQSDFLDPKAKDNQIKKTKEDIDNILVKFLDFYIRNNPDQKGWTAECLSLVEIFFPLHLLRGRSGIVMATYAKFDTKISYFVQTDKKCIRRENYLDQYSLEISNKHKKFIFAFDEQEQGYQIILGNRIDIISPRKLAINNALSSIKREFSIVFSVKSQENIKLLDFLVKNQGAFNELKEHFDKGKTLEPPLEKLAPIYDRLVYREGNSINFLDQVISILAGINKAIEKIVSIGNLFNEVTK